MHLVRRFVRSIVARDLTPTEVEWVEQMLEPAELELWERQPRYDRRHTYEVARRVERELHGTSDADPTWVAAALLHDIGKLESGLGLLGRVLATLGRMTLGRGRVAGWARRDGFVGRLGAYIDHPERGRALIIASGGRDVVAHWAGIHHDVREPGVDPAQIVPTRALRALVGADRD